MPIILAFCLNFTGKTAVLDHSLSIFVYHSIFLTINKVRWSDCSGEDRSKRVFYSIDGLIFDKHIVEKHIFS
jgi:hypothetical protein